MNVTALFTTAQVELIAAAVADGAPSYISVFAGRIADAGVDPVPIVARSLEIMRQAPDSELIWASPREILNLVQANEVGCHIITITHDLLKKLDGLGKSLEQFSLETVQHVPRRRARGRLHALGYAARTRLHSWLSRLALGASEDEARMHHGRGRASSAATSPTAWRARVSRW